MNLKGIATAVLPFAKVLGTALGGPAGPIVNMALTAAGKALGVAPEPEAIDVALKNDPDALIKLRKANMWFEAEMKRLDIDVFALEVKDRGDARAMAIKTGLGPQLALSVIFIGGYFTVLWVLFSGDIAVPANMEQQASILLGILTVNVPIIMSFWFGSSYGSKVKDANKGKTDGEGF